MLYRFTDIYIGGGYIPDEDEDTCAIQLFDSNTATTAISAANGAVDRVAEAGIHRYQLLRACILTQLSWTITY